MEPGAQVTDTVGVPLYMGSKLVALRLVELPSELVANLSDTSPTSLLFKSVPAGPQDKTKATSKYLVLCSHNATYQVRQVQTSNSVFLVKSGKDGETGPENSAREGITIFAQPESTLELQRGPVDARPYLRLLLPLYQDLSNDDEDVLMDDTTTATVRTKGDVFLDVPACEAECQQAWTELAAFEHQGRAFRPTPKALVEVFSSFLDATVIQKLNPCAELDRRTIWKTMDLPDHPMALWFSLLESVASVTGETFTLQSEKTTSWTGRSLLEHQATQSAVNTTDFIKNWQDLLPEMWRSLARKEVLKGCYSEPHPGMIQYSTQVVDAPEGAIVAKAPSKGKKNWHEKFRKGP